MNPQLRSGGKILVDALSIHGTERIFCVPGESYLEVLDALVDVPRIAVIVAKHEGAAANMAEADGKLTGHPGICFVTRGPGATHAANGVHTAFHDSTPMILFIGQVKRSVRGREAFQEVDFPALFRPISKWAAEIDDAARIPELVYRAFQTATSGRPGPVVLSLPEDVLGSDGDVADAPRFSAVQSGPSEGDLARLSQELSAAQRPILVLGGSGWSPAACDSVRRFAEDNHLPVAASFRRQDLLDNLHPCYAGHLSFGIAPALRSLVELSDLVIAVGSRLSDVSTDRYRMLDTAKTRLVHVHPGANELGRVYPPVLGIQAAPAAFAASLHKLEPVKDARWRERTEKAHADYLAFSTPPARSAETAGVDLAAVIGHLSDTLREGSIITSGAGNFAVWVHRFFRYRQAGDGTGANQRQHGIRAACGHRSETTFSRAHMRLHRRRRVLSDVSAGTGHSQTVRCERDRTSGQQRDVRNDPHASGAAIPGPKIGDRPLESRFRFSCAFVWSIC